MLLFDHLRRWWQLRTGEEDTPFDRDVAAWVISLMVHIGLLVLFATFSLLLPTDKRLVLTASAVEVEEEPIPKEFHFAEHAEELGALAEGGVSDARAEAPLVVAETEIVFDVKLETPLGDIPVIEFDDPILEATEFTEDVAIKGEGSVGTMGAAGAIDRITNEILLSLEQRPTLVVWLFDQSASLQNQRDQIVKRFQRVYEELGIIESYDNPAFKRHKNKPLLTSVASFGKQFQVLIEKPTDDIEVIQEAVQAVENDPTGTENVFSATTQVARDFRHYRLKAPRRNVMIVVFTDEAGDDYQALDTAVHQCRKYEMPVYVVGVPAPFGRKDAYIRYVDPDPDYDQRTQWVPVHQGPESLFPERLRLYFSGSNRKDGNLDSGFGPFGLTRLAYETGGIYFAAHPNRKVGRRLRGNETGIMSAYISRFFDPHVMRAYRPDYVSVSEYLDLLKDNAARAALVKAAQISWTQPMQNPPMQFPKIDDAEFARSLSLAQRHAADLEPVIRQVTETLRSGELDRPKLENPRWQVGFDLAIGRALAVKVRTEGYNMMLAKAKQGIKFKNEKSDTWELQPSPEISTGSVLAKEGRQARTYLESVVNQHQGTPWAQLAQQELATPLGWKWRERFLNLSARQASTGGGNSNPPRNPGPPRPPSRPLREPPAL
jgi:hypothetical protein